MLLLMLCLMMAGFAQAAEPPVEVYLVFSSMTRLADRNALAAIGRTKQRQPMTNTSFLIQRNTDYYMLSVTKRNPDVAMLDAFEADGTIVLHKTVFMDEVADPRTGAISVSVREVPRTRLPKDIDESWVKVRVSTP